jgi:hypothetical protein
MCRQARPVPEGWVMGLAFQEAGPLPSTCGAHLRIIGTFEPFR